ncbi:MAG: phosphotransferase family protein [Gemmatimonadales bacterium]
MAPGTRLPDDAPRAARAGEALDTERLAAYLRTALGTDGAVIVSQFPGGHSNLTYLVETATGDLVLRRPPFGNTVRTAHDMTREYRILSALAPVFPPAPRPVHLCEDETVIGAPFYLMERRRGAVIRAALPPGPGLDPAAADRLCRALIDTLADLHHIDYRAVGLGDFGRPEGYVERQVQGWARRFRAAETEPVPAMEAVADWLERHRPAESGAAIIHNDFKFDNLIVDPADPGRIVAVLDWEMATVGDPLLDLGAAIAYWVEPGDPEPMRRLAMGPTTAPGMWTRAQLLAAYRDRTGTDPGDFRFYVVFGLFKLAVILQQIYARYVRGATRDERFAGMNRAVAVLADQARGTIDKGVG